ncbi:hypothetical protein N431DRAFT_475151 [Stipitochalara longipes BDJ]|nr:hypothetical protein N431DRAFT_475151 [Stipitochalara longipes BDJ]
MAPAHGSASRSLDSETNKDDVLLSIYDVLSEIKTLFSDCLNQYDDISDMAEMKKHSSDLLNYIYSKKDGDTVYVYVPKSPAALGYISSRMLEEVEEDVTSMRGYLGGLPSGYHVEHIRSLRNRARSLLTSATAARALILQPIPRTKSQLGHNPYQVPYQPPSWSTKAKPKLMLFNDDELRYYYEDIPVPETEEQRDKAKHLDEMERTALKQINTNSTVQDPASSQEPMSRGSPYNDAAVRAKTKSSGHPSAAVPAMKRKAQELNNPSSFAIPQRPHLSRPSSSPTLKGSGEVGPAAKKQRPNTPNPLSVNKWNNAASAFGSSVLNTTVSEFEVREKRI